MQVKKIKKIKLYGFNNLTKTLSFNMYDICYAKTPQHRREYIEYIDEEYNAERLTGILTEVAKIIGANILNIAQQEKADRCCGCPSGQKSHHRAYLSGESP